MVVSAAARDKHSSSLLVSFYFPVVQFLYSREAGHERHIPVKVNQEVVSKIQKKRNKRNKTEKKHEKLFFSKPEAQTLLLKPKTAALKNKSILHQRTKTLFVFRGSCLHL